MPDDISLLSPQSLTRCQLFLEFAKKDLSRWQKLIGCYIHHAEFGRCEIVTAYSVNDKEIHLEIDSPEKKRRIPVVAGYFAYPLIFLDLELSAELEQLMDQIRLEIQQQQVEHTLRASFDEFRTSFWKKLNLFLIGNYGRLETSPELTEEDIRLAWLWKDGAQMNELERYLQEERPDLSASTDYHWGKMLSARIAEKAAGQFFQQAGFPVQDISIRQLDGTNKYEWQIYDLQVVNHYIDVKNARRSRWNKQNYVEHCVPAFKQTRSQAEVWILGVLSEYLYPKNLLNSEKGSENPIQILGLTCQSLLDCLGERFSIPHHLDFQFRRLSTGGVSYLPPWAFVFPNFIYKERDNLFEQFGEYTQQFDQTRELVRLNPFPFYLAAGLNPIELITLNDEPAEWEKNFIDILLSWIAEKENRHSLPFLVASLLKHFIQMVLCYTECLQSYHPDGYHIFLYYAGNYRFPLFIYDPLETVNSLITSLSILWDKNREVIRKYAHFYLQNALILRASHDENSPKETLVSYCGGRLSDGSACQMYPLIAGREETCPYCHRLVCPKCGYCLKNCPEMEKRRAIQDVQVVEMTGVDHDLSEIPFETEISIEKDWTTEIEPFAFYDHDGEIPF